MPVETGVAPTVAVGLAPKPPKGEPNPVEAVGAAVLVVVPNPKLTFAAGAAVDVAGVPKENFGAVDCVPVPNMMLNCTLSTLNRVNT